VDYIFIKLKCRLVIIYFYFIYVFFMILRVCSKLYKNVPLLYTCIHNDTIKAVYIDKKYCSNDELN